jgi:hypothetical protein
MTGLACQSDLTPNQWRSHEVLDASTKQQSYNIQTDPKGMQAKELVIESCNDGQT